MWLANVSVSKLVTNSREMNVADLDFPDPMLPLPILPNPINPEELEEVAIIHARAIFTSDPY